MSDIHAVPLGTPAREGCCDWTLAFEDVLLRCFAAHFPFEPDCVDHYVARVQREHPEDVPHWRTFGPFPVEIPEEAKP